MIPVTISQITALDRRPLVPVDEVSAYLIPVPGNPTVVRVFPRPRFNVKPRPPSDVLRPVLLTLSRMPGAILIRRRNRKPTSHSLRLSYGRNTTAALLSGRLCRATG